MASSKRQLLIDTALDLFRREGYHATGIDRVIAEAGVARMTLYNHFKSKDELILAALRHRDSGFRNGLVRRVEEAAETPAERLRAVYDALDIWFNSDDFHGCMFINAAAEYHDADNPIHVAAREHKERVRNYIRELATLAGAEAPETLGDSLNLLAEGAIVMAHAANDKNAAKTAKTAAESLLRAAGL